MTLKLLSDQFPVIEDPLMTETDVCRCRTVRVVSEQRPDLLCWVRDTSSVLCTHSVQVLLTWFEPRHLQETHT